MTNLNINPLLTNVYNFLSFKGTYYLTGLSTRIDNNEMPFWEIRLSDASGELTIYCRDQTCIFGELMPNSLVDVEVRTDITGRTPYFRCKFIAPRSNNNYEITCLSKLPVYLSPTPEAVTAMFDLVEQINSATLREFVSKVLLYGNTGQRFITCPASLNHHHNFAGGLIVHSVEIAQQFAADNSLTKDERDIGIVSALLHDIGKTQTLTPDLTRTALGYIVDHNELTLEICAKPLRDLEQTDRGNALLLRHNWTCASPHARYGFKPKNRIAAQLQEYDRFSANGTLTLHSAC